MAAFELDPEEIAMVRPRDTEEAEASGSCSKTEFGLTAGTTSLPTAKSMCECCAWFLGSCGKGCAPRPTGGSTVGD